MSENATPDPSPTRVSVYEAVNESLKETLLGATDQPPETLAARFRKNFPRAAAHWDQNHTIFVNIIEPSLIRDDARAFIGHYAAGVEASGWKALREDG